MADPLYVPLPGRQGRNALNTLTDEQIMRRDYPLAAAQVYGPDMSVPSLDELDQGWRATMPENPIDPASGRVSQFSAPLTQDRMSENVTIADNWDKFGDAAKSLVTRRVNALTHYLPMMARSHLGPTVTMQEISDLLPKEPIPYMGKPR